MKILRLAAGMFVLVGLTAAPGTGQVIAGPQGPVEFIGLQQWTAQKLFDAIRELDPNRPFHACAAVMKMDLGFAEAAAFGYMNSFSADSERYTVVVGVEDSSRVRYRPVGSEKLGLPETWEELRTLIGENMGTLDAAAFTLLARGGPWADPRKFAEMVGADPDALDQIRDLVGRANGEEDRRLAHEVLARDSAWLARVTAALVLANFMDDDTSWHALVGAMTDSHARVRGTAVRIFDGVITQEPGPFDWSAVPAPLQALLAGTNPFAFNNILRILVVTDIDPAFARSLIRESPDLLLAHAGAEHQPTRVPALAFLRAASGEDFGTDVDAWTAWVEGLSEGH